MDIGVLIAVIVFVSCVGKSRNHLAKKCHSGLVISTSCSSDFTEATCSLGLISIKWVRFANDDCNIDCDDTCCEEKYLTTADDETIQKVIHECNYAKSCSLETITSGTVYVQYTCTDIPTTTKSITTYPSTTLGGNISEASISTSTSRTDSELTASSVTDSQPGVSTSGNEEMQKSIDKQKPNEEIRKEILVAVIVIIVLCLASAVVAIILCRRLRARKQQPQTDIYELADQSGLSPQSSRANAEDDMQMTPPLDQSLDIEAQRHDAQTENEYDTPTEMPDNTKAPTTDTCSDIEYEDVDNGLIQQADKRELIDDNADTNNVNLYNRVQHKGNKVFIDPSDDVYDTTREAVREVQTPIDNEYDHADHSKREYVGKQNGDEAYAAENEYDVCETNGTEATILLDGTYDVMATN